MTIGEGVFLDAISAYAVKHNYGVTTEHTVNPECDLYTVKFTLPDTNAIATARFRNASVKNYTEDDVAILEDTLDVIVEQTILTYDYMWGLLNFKGTEAN